MGTIKAGRPRLMNFVEDGIITGAVDNIRHACGVCGHSTRCIIIHDVKMPPGIEMEWTIIAERIRDIVGDQVTSETTGRPVTYIGLGCGDYAKFHRQVAHISDGRRGGLTV